jgi:hypothetical protein
VNGRERQSRLSDIHDIAGSLRAGAPSEMPDLTASILARVDEQRPFLCRGARRWLVGLRYAACGILALGSLATVLAWRYWPERTSVVARETPVSNVLACVGCQTAEQIVELKSTIRDVSVVEPANLLAACSTGGMVASLPCYTPTCEPCDGIQLIIAGPIETRSNPAEHLNLSVGRLVLPTAMLSSSIDDAGERIATVDPSLMVPPLSVAMVPAPQFSFFSRFASAMSITGDDRTLKPERRPLAEQFAPVFSGGDMALPK